MGKQGPCFHCGVTSTPLWRNGPPDKPVLCNACGSRWRTKGSLANYRPLHSRGEATEPVQRKTSKVKHDSGKTKGQKLHKRKLDEVDLESEDGSSDCEPQHEKVLEEESSNRSSSGSAISYSESCAQFGTSDAIDFTGSSQSIVWDSLIPSKKRTSLNRRNPKPSPVEKLTKDLYSILHEQESSHLSGSSEEDLLLESRNSMVSVEIGHGTVLIKNPHSTAQEEESEASSLVIQNKGCTVSESYSTSSSLPMHIQCKELNSVEISMEKLKNATIHGPHDHAKRVKVSYDKFHTLHSSSSLLRFIDLKDLINYEDFMEYLTHEEQQQLMKYLPSVDTSKYPFSLKKMFDSPSFKDTLCTYQRLLSDGIFDLSFLGATIEACKMLKRLVLCEATKSRWVEKYVQLKNTKNVQITGSDPTFPEGSPKCDKSAMKQFHDGQLRQNFSEPKHKIKSPNKLQKCESTDLPSAKSHVNSYGKQGINKYEDDETVKYKASCCSPGSLFVAPSERSLAVLDSLQFTDDSSEQDLLLDVPSNMSFHQAELLDCKIWRQRSFPSSSLVEAHDKHGNQP